MSGITSYSYDFMEASGAMYATNDRNRAIELMEAGYHPMLVPQMFEMTDGYYVMINDGKPVHSTLDDFEKSWEEYC